MGRGASINSTAVTSSNKSKRKLINLWLDDVREPPDESWLWVTDIEQAKQLLLKNTVDKASLDNDLGEDANSLQLPEGRKLVLWMAENDLWPHSQLSIHSSNSVAVEYMIGMIERYSPLTRVGRSTVFRYRHKNGD